MSRSTAAVSTTHPNVSLCISQNLRHVRSPDPPKATRDSGNANFVAKDQFLGK